MPHFARNSCIAYTWNEDGDCRAVMVTRSGDKCKIVKLLNAKTNQDTSVAEVLSGFAKSLNETLRMRWPKYWSFSFSIIPSKEHPGISASIFVPVVVIASVLGGFPFLALVLVICGITAWEFGHIFDQQIGRASCASSRRLRVTRHRISLSRVRLFATP